jgi:hypothetical protein
VIADVEKESAGFVQGQTRQIECVMDALDGLTSFDEVSMRSLIRFVR